MAIFYRSGNVPVHSVLLMATREEALAYPKGVIELGFCGVCGFIGNLAFDPSLHEYSDRYEETQGYSPTFNAFHERLSRDLIDRFELHEKQILEIGCGKGDFLHILCELGKNRGVGIDPAYVERNRPGGAASEVSFVPEFFTGDYQGPRPDLVACKMTLEHIPDTAEFVSMVGRCSRDDRTVFFFQVPDMERILQDQAFWDVYYEHCSYFTADSLAYLFRKCGFKILDTWRDYDDQYLMISAQRGTDDSQSLSIPPAGREFRANQVDDFVNKVHKAIDDWRQVIFRLSSESRRVVIWGGGSKGVTFLNTVDAGRVVEFAVDINPYKAGAFMPGTGQETIEPGRLLEIQPDVVIVMNPIYADEIRGLLSGMGLAPEIMLLGS